MAQIEEMTKKEENALLKKLEKWIDEHLQIVMDAQELSQEISSRGLIHEARPLPFEIGPSADKDALEGFDLHVFIDHPTKAQAIIRMRDESFEFIPQPEYMDDPYTATNIEEALAYIARYDDVDHKEFKRLRKNIENRKLNDINEMLAMWLIDYHENLDPQLEEIKGRLNAIERCALFCVEDGQSTPLERVMGRWDLALLWTPCPFVVIGNPDKSVEVRKMVTDFVHAEARAASLLSSALFACMLEGNYDMELITDSPDSAEDASGWLTKDEKGMPQLGPMIHATKIVAHSYLDVATRGRIIKL